MHGGLAPFILSVLSGTVFTSVTDGNTLERPSNKQMAGGNSLLTHEQGSYLQMDPADYYRLSSFREGLSNKWLLPPSQVHGNKNKTCIVTHILKKICTTQTRVISRNAARTET